MEAHEYHAMAALESHFWWYRALHDFTLMALEQHFNTDTRAMILDAGCGTGGLLQQAVARFPAATFVGMDVDPLALDYARTKTAAPLVNGSVNTLPFADNSLDAVLAMDVMYHRNVSEQAFLSELQRCLKPGGFLLMNLPAYEWMRSAHDRHVHTRSRYTAGRVKHLLTQSGFLCEYVGYRISLLFPLMVLHRLTAGQVQAHSDVKMPNPLLDRILYRVCCIEKQLWQQGLRLPFGGSVWVKGVKK